MQLPGPTPPPFSKRSDSIASICANYAAQFAPILSAYGLPMGFPCLVCGLHTCGMESVDVCDVCERLEHKPFANAPVHTSSICGLCVSANARCRICGVLPLCDMERIWRASPSTNYFTATPHVLSRPYPNSPIDILPSEFVRIMGELTREKHLAQRYRVRKALRRLEKRATLKFGDSTTLSML